MAAESPFALLRLDMRSGRSAQHETEVIEIDDQIVAVASPTRVHVRTRESVINLLRQSTHPLHEGVIHEAFREVKRQRSFDAVLCVCDEVALLITPHRQSGLYIVTKWRA